MPLRLALVWFLVLASAWAGRAGDPAGAIAGGFASTVPPSLPDPFPLRRVWAPPAQLGDLLKALPPGPVLRMPRRDFERAVQDAALRRRQPAARLLNASYAAALEADGLRGTAELTIESPAAGAAWIVEPWTAALTELKTTAGKPIPTTTDAVGRAAWLMPTAGEVKLIARWSLRLQDADADERCEIGFPAAPTSLLELDLPSDRMLTSGVLGPFPGLRAGRVLVRVPLGRTAGELRFPKSKSPTAAGDPPRFRVGLTRRLELLPGEANLTATLTLEQLRGAPELLTVLLDPAWRPLETNAGKPLRSTTVEKPGEPTRLVLRPDREWPTEIVLKLTAARSRAAATGADWTPPTLALPDSVPGIDRWEIVRDAGVLCLGASLGDYRVVSSPEDGETMRLIGLPAAVNEATRRPPRLRIAERDADYTLAETVEFVASPVPRWSSVVRIAVVRGPMDQLPMKLPAGWKLSAAEASDDRLQGVVVSNDGLRWQRPAVGGETVAIRYELTPEKAEPGKPIEIPRVAFPGATEREGTIAILVPATMEIALDPAQGDVEAGRWRLKFRGLPPTVRVVVRDRNDTVTPQVVARDEPQPTMREKRDRVEFSEAKASAVLERDGRIAVTATARGNTGGSVAVVSLSPEARLVGVRVGSAWSPRVERRDDRLEIPWPADAEQLEVAFSLPSGAAWPGIAFPGCDELGLYGTVADGLQRFPELDSPREPVPFESGFPVAIESTRIAAAGWFAAGLVATLAFVRGLRSARGLWLLAAAISGAALLALPEGWSWAVRPPVVALFAVVLVLYLRTTTARSASMLACWLVLAVPLTARDDEPVPILIAPGANGEEAFVPQRVWERLTAKPAPSAPTVLGIDYEGDATGDVARFTAKVRLELADNAERRWELPWDGIRLESIAVDGKPAFAEAVPGRPGRVAVAVVGLGVREVTAKFQVAIVTLSTGREATFQGADAEPTRLTFRPPSGAVGATCESRRGVETFRDGTMVVDRGRGTTIRIRWGAAVPTASTPPSVRLAAVWDLTEDESTLTAAFQLAGDASTPRIVSIDVPAGWEPAGAILRRGDAEPTVARTLRWDLSTNQWTLKLSDAADRGTLVAKFYSRSLSTWKPTLKPPRLREAIRTETLAAVRRDGLILEDLERVRMIDFPADELVRRFGTTPELKLDRSPADRVFSAVDAAGELRPGLRRIGEQATGRSETRWTFGPETDVDAAATFTRTTPETMIELDCPEAIAVHEVRSAELEGWCRYGPKLQLRFRRPTREGTIQILGRAMLKLPANGGSIDLPAVRVPGSPASIRLRLPLGWTAHGTDAQRPTFFRIEDAIPIPAKQTTVKVAIDPPQPIAEAALHGKLERTAEGVRYVARLAFRAPANRPLRFYLAINEGTLGTPTLELAGMGQARLGPAEATPDGVRRTIDVPAERVDETMTMILTQKSQASGNAVPAELRLMQGSDMIPWAERTLSVAPEFQLKEGPSDRSERSLPDGVEWRTKRYGSWTFATIPAAETPKPVPALAPTVAPEPRDDPSRTLALGWAAGALLLGFSHRFGLRRPEFAAGFGLLSAVVVGATTPAGVAFLMVAAGGVFARIVLMLPSRLSR